MIFKVMGVIMVARKAIEYIDKGRDHGLNLRKQLYLESGKRKEIEKQSEESPDQDKTT